MLQIIGWMGCAYLLVKALELFGTASMRKNQDGEMESLTVIAGAIALLSAIGFFLILNTQVSELGSQFPY